MSSPTKKEMDAVFAMCRNNHWKSVLQCLKLNPQIGTARLTMDNHIVTTVCHQAITSKGDVQARAAVILQILSRTPDAAQIKNGYGSLCLHCACQRNVKMNAKTKEKVILALVNAYPDALIETGGVGKRTPLHIIFTDYVSSTLTMVMIEKGTQACFMKDKKGYLPLHVAVSRHVSPDKLTMLLEANPRSITQTTHERKTALQIAKETATNSHPNYALIEALETALTGGAGSVARRSVASMVPARVSSNDSAEEPRAPKKRKARSKSTRSTKTSSKKKRAKVKREPTKTEAMGTPMAADLLLNFARSSPAELESHPEEINTPPTQVAEV